MPASDTAPQQTKMGAGVIPFAVAAKQVHFLFQTTFSGRKTGYLIDFGGGVGPGEDYRTTAIREFVEETETMYFADDISKARRNTDMVENQIPLVAELFEETLSRSPDWWCMRSPGDPTRPKLWKTFFVEFPYRDVDNLNREWEAAAIGRFKKRRMLHWVSAGDLLDIYETEPERLWKRVRQLQNAPAVVDAIRQQKET